MKAIFHQNKTKLKKQIKIELFTAFKSIFQFREQQNETHNTQFLKHKNLRVIMKKIKRKKNISQELKLPLIIILCKEKHRRKTTKTKNIQQN